MVLSAMTVTRLFEISFPSNQPKQDSSVLDYQSSLENQGV